MEVARRQPLTFIQDPYPSFSSIAVNPTRDEIVMTDENRLRIMVYDRLAVTPASAVQTTPKRVISGLNTHTQSASDVYVDPRTGEIYVINNDTVHNTTIWGPEATGAAPPDREFASPYGNFGAAVDESRQEMHLTLQHNSAIMVYTKSSGMKDHAVRLIQGDKTRLADPHAIAFDLVQGMYNLNPAKFGLPSDNFVTLAKNFGDQTEYWHGVDVNVAMRFVPGLLVQGARARVARWPILAISSGRSPNRPKAGPRIPVSPPPPRSGRCSSATTRRTGARR